SRRLGERTADQVGSADLLAFLPAAEKRFKLTKFTSHKHTVSIIAAFNWGAGVGTLKNPQPCLAPSFRPFAQVERYKAPPNELHEDELPTKEEIEALFGHADDDLEQLVERGK